MRSITSILLAVLVLVTSTSFRLDTHLCGGSVQSWSLFGVAAGCGMEMDRAVEKCANHAGAVLVSEPCCADHDIQFKGQELNTLVSAPLSVAVAYQPVVALLFTDHLGPVLAAAPIAASLHFWPPPLSGREVLERVSRLLI